MDKLPSWLAKAWTELGEAEVAGAPDNATILGYARQIGHAEVGHDEVAWCAAFVGACLERTDTPSTRSLLARSYLSWGVGIAAPRLGAITVLARGGDPALGHVGFLVGWTESLVLLLGGNQGNAVSVAPFSRSDVVGLRWPGAGSAGAAATQVPKPQAADDPKPPTPADDFATALTFVLAQEGGYGEDPYDPGGPTNQGITLADYAQFKGRTVDSGSIGSLKQELRSISPQIVRAIYLERYWTPAQCPELPSGVALMHFDCAVNQGVGRAARFLQQAAGADVDGEIGPLTRAAVANAQMPALLTRYAELRRQHYRGLSHFWRFGRGWLARVDAALAASQRLAAENRPSIPAPAVAPAPSPAASQSTKPSSTKETHMESQPKWWGQSLTIWGAITTGLTTVLPIIGPLLGINITAEMVQQLGGQFVQLVQVLGGLIGTFMTIYGRVRATQPLERRPVSLRI